jgi:hypothetical protein
LRTIPHTSKPWERLHSVDTIFELVVWLKYIDLNENFALVYARIHFEGQVEHYERLITLVEREANLYDRLAEDEKADLAEAMRTIKESYSDPVAMGQALAEEMKRVSDAETVELRLDSELVLYGDDVVTNGYSFQASLLRTQVLPTYREQAELNRESLRTLCSNWDKNISEVIKEYKIRLQNNRVIWPWGGPRLQEDLVQMKEHYDFIYSYTSRLLHAKPNSIISNQQSLSDGELLIFWRDIHRGFRWIYEYAKKELPASNEEEGH